MQKMNVCIKHLGHSCFVIESIKGVKVFCGSDVVYYLKENELAEDKITNFGGQIFLIWVSK